MQNKDKIVRTLVSGVGYLMKKNNIAVYEGEALFRDSRRIEVNGETLTFDDLILATGSYAAVPPIPGADAAGVMSATEILDIDHIPGHLTIIGGGVIGCELACVFNEFGSKVTIVEMMEHLLPGIDTDLTDVLHYAMSREGIRILTGASVFAVDQQDGLFAVRISSAAGQETLPAGDLLIAAGRKGNTRGMEALGIALERGYVVIDEHLRTNDPHIYAIGDVTGRIQLAHVASAQGIAAAENIAGGDATVDYSAVPNCIFTVPEIACAGLSETQAAAAGIDCTAVKFPMRANGRAMTLYETDGFTKLVSEKATGRIIGAAVVGACATEIIGELTYIIRTGGTLQDVKETIHAHPTVSETIHEAAHLALGQPMQI